MNFKKLLFWLGVIVAAVMIVGWLVDGWKAEVLSAASADTDAKVGRLRADTGIALRALRDEQRPALPMTSKPQPEPPAFGIPNGKVGFAEKAPESRS
jgi:hypothetical protein